MSSKNPRPHVLQTKVNAETNNYILEMVKMLGCTVSEYLRYCVAKERGQ